MTGWEMIDLHGILCLVAAYPEAFAPQAFEALAALTASRIAGAENLYRRTMQAWPLQLPPETEYPHWLTVENAYCTPLCICVTEQESALLRSILLTAARLRREERLPELTALAEATNHFPMMIAWQRGDALRCVKKELRGFCRLQGVALVQAAPENEAERSAVWRRIKRRAANQRKQEEQSHDPS